MATGLSRPYLPPIPGIEYAEQYSTMPVDPEDYTDQRVLIIGKGYSAFETADNLLETAAVIHVAGLGQLLSIQPPGSGYLVRLSFSRADETLKAKTLKVCRRDP